MRASEEAGAHSRVKAKDAQRVASRNDGSDELRARKVKRSLNEAEAQSCSPERLLLFVAKCRVARPRSVDDEEIRDRRE